MKQNVNAITWFFKGIWIGRIYSLFEGSFIKPEFQKQVWKKQSRDFPGGPEEIKQFPLANYD